MGRRMWCVLDDHRGRYVAVWREDAGGDQPALAPAAAWDVMRRVLARPKEPRQIMSLARNITGGVVGGMVSARAIQRALASGEVVLLTTAKPELLPPPGAAESVAEQLREARVVRTWIEMEVVDAMGRPMAGERYECMLPDGTMRGGKLDKDGKARLDGIDPGNCVFSLPDLHGEDWKAA